MKMLYPPSNLNRRAPSITAAPISVLIMAVLIMIALPLAADPNPPVPDTERLGGPDRPLVFLATDKPIYKPGETLYARLVALQADSYFPLRNGGQAILKIKGPRQNEMATLTASLTDSTAGFAWPIPEGSPGGRYQVSAEFMGSPTAVRDFEIRAYKPPRLKSQIEFLREGYGPGEEVSAVVKVTRAEGGVPEGARLTAIARVDGREAARIENLSLDAEGNGRASFTLPQSIELGEGSLAFVIEDGGQVETASKTIPILMNTMDISFYPEGGELVSGLPTRVYVQALRPDGKPADLTGQLVRVDKNGQALEAQPVADLSTLHEGRGFVALTPLDKESYALRLTRPAGIDRLYPLPPVRASGAVIRPAKAAFAFDEPVKLTVQGSDDSKAAYVSLYHREQQAAWAELKPGLNEVSLDPGEAEGVLMATVWDNAGKPLAERLIFRQPKFTVKIKLSPEPAKAGEAPVPGGKMKLRVETTDENGKPVEAVVGLTVTDDALLEMVETRDQAPSLPVMVLLENEVTDLVDAAVYFDPENQDAARDIDLLLGVQGWRRFVLANLDKALKENPEAVRRALAVQIRPVHRQYMAREADVERQYDIISIAPSRASTVAINDEGYDRFQLQSPYAWDGGGVSLHSFYDREGRRDDVLAEIDAKKIAPRHQAGQLVPSQGSLPPTARPAPPRVSIREYAHKARADRRPNDRRDFTETIYWHAGLRTNPRNGTATVEFDLPDSVTTYKVRADAFGNNGALGQGGAEIASLEPFYTEPKLPPSLLAGDRPLIPVTLVNSTAEDLDGVGLIPRSEDLKPNLAKAPVELGSRARERVLISLTPDKPGQFELSLNAAAGPYADTVTRKLEVLPRGFPISHTASGLVGPNKPFSTTITMAPDAAPGSIKTMLKVYPSPLANMEEALNALLRQPHGCFEQTSSTSYPLVMAQHYFLSHQGISPGKIKRADELLKQGYNKLIGFESKGGGYEWYGGNPGHEALTAYGLMQFMEMKAVRPVDDDMIDRTRAWLLSRRDGQGGFKRSDKGMGSFNRAPVPLTNLYILWSLLESGEKPESLKAEIETAKKILADTDDTYLKALGTNILYLAGDKAAARAQAADLRKSVAEDGHLSGAQTSITRSGGDSLNIETTSLAILGWLRVGEDFAGDVENSMKWLFEHCKSGRFGSTQSTILALKAINAYDTARAKPKAPGSLRLIIDGQEFGAPVAFDENSQGALELPDFAAKLSPGEHRLELVMTGGGDMPFALETGYHANQPADSPNSPLELATSLSAAKIKEGELIDLKVSIAAKAAEVPLPLAVIGLPAGLEPRHERLKEMKDAGEIDAYEILGRELVLYWRNLKALQKLELTIPLTAEIPGVYSAPASRAYGYYLDEYKTWVAGERIEISPR